MIIRKKFDSKKIIYYVVLSDYSFDTFDKIIGVTEPNLAEKESLRNKFGLSILENSIHSSKKHLIIKEIKHFLNSIDFEQLLKMINTFDFENKIILHGGSTSEYCDSNLNFYKTILSDYVEGEDIILYIPFAGYDKDWNTEKISNNLEKFLGKKCNIILGNIENLDNQILDSKYIYINGGDYKKLFNYIGYLKDKKYLLHGKNIIGVSAGANILAKYSYSNDYKEVFEGIGLLDIKTVCHFDGNNELINLLDSIGNKCNIFTIEDKKYLLL